MKFLIPYQLKIFLKKHFWYLIFFNKIYGSAVKRNKSFTAEINSGNTSAEHLNIFTTNGEDGILLRLLQNIKCSNKVFVDIGSNDCVNSNCANLAFHHQWTGIFIEGDKKTLERGKYVYTQYFKKRSPLFTFINTIVKPDNINEILETNGAIPETDLLSIDLDGNDYHIWEALEFIKPKIVVIETQVEKGNTEYIPHYEKNFELFEQNIPKGASPLSMQKLAQKKGYQLAGSNREGYNLFFVRNDFSEKVKRIKEEDLSN